MYVTAQCSGYIRWRTAAYNGGIGPTSLLLKYYVRKQKRCGGSTEDVTFHETSLQQQFYRKHRYWLFPPSKSFSVAYFFCNGFLVKIQNFNEKAQCCRRTVLTLNGENRLKDFFMNFFREIGWRAAEACSLYSNRASVVWILRSVSTKRRCRWRRWVQDKNRTFSPTCM